MIETLTVYLPAEGHPSMADIALGSGIVGSPEPIPPALGPCIVLADETPRVRVDYEGNLYDAVNMNEYEERVYHAASRQLYNNGRGYPTVARRWVEEAALIAVGTIEVDTLSWKYRLDITDQARVDAWVALYPTRTRRR